MLANCMTLKLQMFYAVSGLTRIFCKTNLELPQIAQNTYTYIMYKPI